MNDELTDQFKLKKLLNEFGIEFKEQGNTITCKAGDKLVSGYIEFYTVFEFNSKQKFVEMGIYE